MTAERPLAEAPDHRFDVGGYVARARRTADLSQRGLAALVGVKQATVARWETEARPMTVVALDQVLRLAGLRLAVVDEGGQLVAPVPADGVRDNAGRRFPSHLDVVPPDRRPSNRGAGPRYDRPEAQGWYALRGTRDRDVATGGGRPADHPTVSDLAELQAAQHAARSARWGWTAPREQVVECTCPDACFEQRACPETCGCRCETPWTGL